MRKYSLLVHRIKMSIGAIVILFLLGGMVLGSSMMWFDFKLKSEAFPRSMTEKHQQVVLYDSSLWYVLLLVCAGVGLPLGMYVVQTLHDAEIKLTDEMEKGAA